MSLLFQIFRKTVPAGLVLLLFTTCQEPPGNNEPYPNSTLTLEALDVSSTEAWLRISLTGVDSTASDTIPLILKRDGETVSSLDFVPFPRPGSGRADTTVMDAGLEPSRSYTYTAYRRSLSGTALIDSSAPLTLTTLDTTSHDFTWTIDTLGSYGSYFNDVAIIDENNIWAVGNIVVPDPDSSFNGTGWKEYNAARWDGERWNLMGIYSNTLDLYSIFYFSENDIWVTDYCSPIHWDGQEWTLYHLQNMGLDACAGNAIWGSSPEDVYFVGDNGSIVHYDGSGFIRLESGTDKNLFSVSGTLDGKYVFTCGTNQYYESVILQISDYQVETIYKGDGAWSLPAGAPRATYVYGDTAYFASGISVWKYNYLTGESNVVYEAQNYEHIYASAIHVNSPNDIFISGARSEFLHYNGVRWSSDLSIWAQFGYHGVAIYDMDVKGNQVVMVGSCYGAGKGLIARGRR